MAEPALKIVYAVTLDGTETVQWDEGGGTITATLDAGTYWCYAGTAITGYPSLYNHIVTKMNALAGLGYTYEISDATPTSSSAWVDFGTNIYTTNPALSWTWIPAGTVNALEVLGWNTSDSNTASASGIVTSPRTYRGAWRATESPSRWTSYPMQIVSPSTELLERDDAYFLARGTRRMRPILIEFVTGAHVFKNRADLAAFATSGQLATGDDNNALEYMWEWMRTGGEAIAVWYADGDDLDLDADGGGYYEIVRLADVDNMRDFSSMLRLIRAGGELYNVEFNLVRVGTDFTWVQ